MKKNIFGFLLILLLCFQQLVTVVIGKELNFSVSQNQIDSRIFQDQPVAGNDDKRRMLSATPWYWQSLMLANTSNENIESPKSYKLEFRNDGSVGITSDCNKVVGTFSAEGEKLSVAVGPATLMQCPGNSRGDQFVKLLAQADSFFVSESQLIIVLKEKQGLLIFSSPTPALLCGGKADELNSIADDLDPKISSKLDKLLAGFLWARSANPPGASMLVITPKGRYFKSVGVSDVANCGILRADSPYQIGSNTKLMTTAIIFQLQEKGKLSIKDPISKWLPDLSAKIINGSQINIEMLLTHTSGIYDYFGSISNPEDIGGGVKNKAMLTRAFTPRELVMKAINFGKADFSPGEAGKWNYSNTGYILLGLIIEKATGKSYEDNLRERIFKPLRLKKTYLQKGLPPPVALPVAYYEAPFKYTTHEWNASQGWSAGAVVSTSEEFAVFLKALFTGKLFKKKTTLELMRSYPPAGKNVLGEGTIYAHGMLDNNGVLGHGGQTMGFISDGGYIPENDVTIVIWSNRATGATNRIAAVEAAKIVLGKN